jgi:hypothetical protein
LTLLIIAVKYIISVYLFQKYQKTERTTDSKLTFILAMSLMIFGLGIARSIYFYYDFYLTEYNPALLYIQPNITYWKIATFLGNFFAVPILYVVERDIYQMRLKRIPSLGMLSVSIFQLLYPISNQTDFELVSTIGMLAVLFTLFVPIAFVNLARKTSGQIRKVCIALASCIVIYGLFSSLMSEQLLSTIDLLIPGARLVVIITVPIVKTICLILLTYSTINFQI